MLDNFVFSAGQALSTLSSTGVISTNIWDLEEDVTADQQVVGWFNFLIRSTTNTSAGEGVWIEVRSEDETNLNWDSASAGQITNDQTDQHCLGALLLRDDQIAAGAEFAIGVRRAALGRYLGIWYRAASSSLNGATAIDAWFSYSAEEMRPTQKKPGAAIVSA